jgi:soluble lytic murein transglycosylase-like protein
LWGAPNAETVEGRFQQVSGTAIEKQRASVGRQMARISENDNRRARQLAQSSWERQRASIERQRRSLEDQPGTIEKQRASVERQLQAVRPEGSLFTAAAEPPSVVSWEIPADRECRRIPPAQIHPYVEQVAKRESLTPELLHVVIDRESSFLPCAVSRKGAMGMMQLMPATAAELGVANPFNPEENIDGGARYLSYLMQRFGGDLRLVLAAYNAGPGRVDDYRGVPPIPETVSYVSSILRQLRSAPPKAPSDPKSGGRI